MINRSQHVTYWRACDIDWEQGAIKGTREWPGVFGYNILMVFITSHLGTTKEERCGGFRLKEIGGLLCHEGFSGQPVESEIQAEDISGEGAPENLG